MDKNVSAKRKDTGKWWGFGNIRVNQWGNEQLSFKKTPEFKAFLRACFEDDTTEWINFSLFDGDKKDKPESYTAPKDESENSIPF